MGVDVKKIKEAISKFQKKSDNKEKSVKNNFVSKTVEIEKEFVSKTVEIKKELEKLNLPEEVKVEKQPTKTDHQTQNNNENDTPTTAAILSGVTINL